MELTSKEIRRVTDTSSLPFRLVSELGPSNEVIGQEQALKALKFGLTMNRPGYNIFVEGQSGTGRKSQALKAAGDYAATRPDPYDWVYVRNFDVESEPNLIALKKGEGSVFKTMMEEFVVNAGKYLSALYEDGTLEEQSKLLQQKFQTERAAIFAELNKSAEAHSLVLKTNETGLQALPLFNGQIINQEIFQSMTEEQRETMQAHNKAFEAESRPWFEKLMEIEQRLGESLQNLEQQYAQNTVFFLTKNLRERFCSNQEVMQYIRRMQVDILKHLRLFRPSKEAPVYPAYLSGFGVNLFVDNKAVNGAPVIYLGGANFTNLFGSVEYVYRGNAPAASHMSIRPGALQKANGGYLLLDAEDLLKSNGILWAYLKHCLLNKQVRIENTQEERSVFRASLLFPEAMPLSVKVILVGGEYIHYHLYQNDDDFRKLFKIKCQFDYQFDRTDETVLAFARFVNNRRIEENLLDFDASAVGALLDVNTREAGHQEKLSAGFNAFLDYVYEAEAYARMEGAEVVTGDHVKLAARERRLRSSLYETKSFNQIYEGHSLIEVKGEKIGQINGLSVLTVSDCVFGQPSRITVTCGAGQKGIINIEKEVDMSGPIHSKGVLIIGGFLTERFGRSFPLSLTAHICFEQNYGGVDGDSASSTELYALLSSVAGVPIKQNLAVTGSVNQMGEIQPIGGANEKIEGFFKVCQHEGLTGDQGVLLPVQNVKNLMLSDEVVEAVEKGLFHIYAVSTIEEGIELLTGMPAVKTDENGMYTMDCIYGRALAQFLEWHESENDHPLEETEAPAGEAAEEPAPAEITEA